MNEEEIKQLKDAIGQAPVFWQNNNGALWEVSSIRNAPVFEGDTDPEPCAYFKYEEGYAALSNCEALSFFQASTLFVSN